MRARSGFLRSLRASPGVAASVVVAWAAGFGLGSAALGSLDREGAGYSHPLLPGSGEVPGWRASWTALRTAGEIQGEALSLLVRLGCVLAGLLLAVALVDLVTLLLTRAAARRPEMAMRAAVGAGPRRLLAGLLAEGAALSALGGAAGGLVAAAAFATLRASWRTGAWPWRDADPARALVLSFVAFALVTALCWLFPLTAGWRGDLRRFLGAGPRATPGPADGLLRSSLVVVQIAVSLVLLVSAALLVRGFAGSGAAAVSGFDPRETLTARVELPAASAAAYTSLVERVNAVPGVVDTSAATPGTWLGVGASERVTTLCAECWSGIMVQPISQGPALLHLVAPGFFRTIGATLLRGREFGPEDGADAPATAVVNDAFAYRLFPHGDPIGKWIRVGGFAGDRYQVVGVVGQVGAAAVGSPAGPAPAVYLSLLRHPAKAVELAVRSPRDPSLLAPLVERAVRAGASGALVSDLMTMERRLASFRAPFTWFAALFAALALGALFVATSSLYGVTACGVERRRREIGIRMAVGATVRDVVRLIVGQTARVTALGLGFGMIGALTVGRLLQLRVAGIDPLDPLVYAPLALLFAAVALVASYRPALRAARNDPQHSLREETA